MWEKIAPIIIVLIVIRLGIRLMNMKKDKPKVNARHFEYKKRIDDFMRISNYDEGVDAGNKLREEVRQGLGGNLISEVPESMRDVRKNLNLIIDGVSYAVKEKIGEKSGVVKYTNGAEMFDEIVEIINRHKVV